MVLLLEPGIPGSCGHAARVEHHSANVCKEVIQGFSLHHKSNCNVQDAFGILGIWSETSLSWSLSSDSKSQCCLALGSKGSSLFGGCVCRHAHGAITTGEGGSEGLVSLVSWCLRFTHFITMSAMKILYG